MTPKMVPGTSPAAKVKQTLPTLYRFPTSHARVLRGVLPAERARERRGQSCHRLFLRHSIPQSEEEEATFPSREQSEIFWSPWSSGYFVPCARLLHSLLWKHVVCQRLSQVPQSVGLWRDKEGKPVGSWQTPRACGSPVVTGVDRRELGATGVQLKAFLKVQVSPSKAGINLWMGL